MGSALKNHRKCIVIKGANKLNGTVKIQGSKNACLPILAATLLTGEECIINNCPRITDIYHMLEIIESIGGYFTFGAQKLVIRNCGALCSVLPSKQVKSMRSSMFLLGAMLARNQVVCMDYPGGCVIGDRPIDIHIRALTQMGVDFSWENGILCGCASKGLHGAEITLPFPSVGATENIILAGVTAKGKTVIHGAAKEPEIVYLCQFLRGCGADILGEGSKRIEIRGRRYLCGTQYRIPSDRIVAGTYAYAVAATGGEAFLEEAPFTDMQSSLDTLRKMGASCRTLKNGIYVKGPKRLWGIDRIVTEVYPGFPTDLQSVAIPLLALSQKQSIVEERIFENRFSVVGQLLKMGAAIEQINNNVIRIHPVKRLYGAEVEACDLRAGAALVVAGLMALGETKVLGVELIERGYENICRDLRELGACIYLSR